MPAFNAFSLGGIRVRIDQSWFIAFILFSWTLSAGYFPFQVPDYPKYTYWLAGSLSALAFFGCVLLHELTHCIVARRLGIPVRRITLFIFGGVSEMEQMQPAGARPEFLTTIAGPLASMGLGALFLSLAVLATGVVSRIVVEMLRYMYTSTSCLLYSKVFINPETLTRAPSARCPLPEVEGAKHATIGLFWSDACLTSAAGSTNTTTW